MTIFSAKRRSWGPVVAAVLLFAGLVPALGDFTVPARAEGSLEDFFARLKARKSHSTTSTSNANAGGHDAAHTIVGKATTETAVVADQGITPMLTPAGADELRAAEARYRSIVEQGGFPKVAKANLKKGATGKNVIALNRRLFVEGYVRVEATEGEYASIFTSATEDGLRRFQRNMGLAVTGKLDAVTADVLNIPAERRLSTIQANIARMEAYGQELGSRYVVVNIPAMQIETVQDGRVFSQHNAIVGRPARPSPVVMAALSDVNFNPYWNAPVSIVEKDIIPKLRGGGDVLRDMNIKVFKGFGGPEIDPDTVNWRKAVPDDYHFRQEPGEGNAMATAKINFPSPFGVYMHDTPEKQLFASGSRFYSSGCVRVQNMPLLVNWVLNGQDGIDEAVISTLGETLERRDVKLVDPPQLRFAYLTAWPAAGGTVAFRNDIYELDGTGFVTGQPMPVGELSPDGQRFVLKPLPRLVASVEDDSSVGGFFSFGKKKTASGATEKKSIFGTSNSDDASSGSGSAIVKSNAPEKKTATTSKSSDPKVKNKKKSPGLFDWSAYRKEQASGKSTSKTAAKKKDDKTKTASKKDCKPGDNGKLPKGCDKADVKKADAKSADGKKKAAETKTADGKKKATETKTAEAKAADAKVKDPKAKDAKATTAAKAAPDAGAKKPDAKKVECKPGADGKLPDGCKTADAKKKPVEPTATN